MADDDRGVRHLLRLALELEGFTVVGADDGEMALECARRYKPDAIVLDAVMPRLGGMEVCRRLRLELGWSPLIVMVTGHSDVADRRAALECGVDDYVEKPVRVGDLVERMKPRLRPPVPVPVARRLLGTPEIFDELRRRIEVDEPVTAVAVELQGRPLFVRRYGFERADRVLAWLAELLLDLADEPVPSLVGRLGTADFFQLAEPDDAVPLVASLKDAFSVEIGRWYDAPDLERGWIEVRDRVGHLRRSRLLTLSIGVAPNRPHRAAHHLDLVERAVELAIYARNGANDGGGRRSAPQLRGADGAISPSTGH